MSMKELRDDQERLINSDGNNAADDDGNEDGDSAGRAQRSLDGKQDGHDADSHVDAAQHHTLREPSQACDKEEESLLSGLSPWRRTTIGDLQQYSQPGRKLKFRGTSK